MWKVDPTVQGWVNNLWFSVHHVLHGILSDKKMCRYIFFPTRQYTKLWQTADENKNIWTPLKFLLT